MIYEGYERFKMGLELLGPYLAHVHIKNAEWIPDGLRADGTVNWQANWSPLESGFVDYSSLLEDLNSIGYEGYLGVEDFSGQYDSREMLTSFAEFIRERISIRERM